MGDASAFVVVLVTSLFKTPVPVIFTLENRGPGVLSLMFNLPRRFGGVSQPGLSSTYIDVHRVHAQPGLAWQGRCPRL